MTRCCLHGMKNCTSAPLFAQPPCRDLRTPQLACMPPAAQRQAEQIILQASHISTKASQEKTKRCLLIHFVLTERRKICSFPSPHPEHLPGDFPPRRPNKTQLCRLKCNTRSCHQVEAQSQSLPSLPGLMPCRAGTGTEVWGSFSSSLLGKPRSVKGSGLRCSRCLCLLVTG